MVLTALTEILGFTHMTLLPVFAKEVLHVGPAGLGVMTAARQVGGLIGLWILAALASIRKKGLMMFVTATGFGAGLMVFSVAGEFYAFIAVLLFVNACAMAVDTLYKTLMQELVSDEERGRAMGSWVLSIGFAPGGPRGRGRAGRRRRRPAGAAHQRRGAGGYQRRLGSGACPASAA